jgi:hypothetical protein
MSRRKIGSPVFSLFSFQDIITSVTGIMILITLVMAVELIQRTEQAPQQQTAELVRELEHQINETRDTVEELRSQMQQQQTDVTPDAFLDTSILQAKLQRVQDRRQRGIEDSNSLAQRKQKTDSRLARLRQEQTSRKDEITTLAKLQEELAKKNEKLKKLSRGNRVIYNPAQGTSRTPWLVELSGTKIVSARMGIRAAPQEFTDISAFQGWVSQLVPSSNYCMVVIRPSAADSYEDTLKMLDGLAIQYGYDAIDEKVIVIDAQDGAGI